MHNLFYFVRYILHLFYYFVHCGSFLIMVCREIIRSLGFLSLSDSTLINLAVLAAVNGI